MTVAPQAQAETEVVTGQIQGIVQKGADKWQVEVNIGQQNPRRLWTKDAALVGQLSMMIGQSASFLCGKSHWNRQDGSPVTSLWINGVAPAGAFPEQQPQPPPQPPTVVQPQVAPMAGIQGAGWQQPVQQAQPPMPQVQQPPQPQQRVTEDERERRIHRQTASKVAGILISHVPAEQRTLDNVLNLAEKLVRYYEHGLGNPEQPQADGDYQHTDDDIPF